MKNVPVLDQSKIIPEELKKVSVRTAEKSYLMHKQLGKRQLLNMFDCFIDKKAQKKIFLEKVIKSRYLTL